MPGRHRDPSHRSHRRRTRTSRRTLARIVELPEETGDEELDFQRALFEGVTDTLPVPVGVALRESPLTISEELSADTIEYLERYLEGFDDNGEPLVRETEPNDVEMDVDEEVPLRTDRFPNLNMRPISPMQVVTDHVPASAQLETVEVVDLSNTDDQDTPPHQPYSVEVVDISDEEDDDPPPAYGSWEGFQEPGTVMPAPGNSPPQEGVRCDSLIAGSTPRVLQPEGESVRCFRLEVDDDMPSTSAEAQRRQRIAQAQPEDTAGGNSPPQQVVRRDNTTPGCVAHFIHPEGEPIRRFRLEVDDNMPSTSAEAQRRQRIGQAQSEDTASAATNSVPPDGPGQSHQQRPIADRMKHSGWIPIPANWRVHPAQQHQLPQHVVERLQARVTKNLRRNIRVLEKGNGQHYRVRINTKNEVTVSVRPAK
ncbi:uncharacterized protein [Drosophila takahashii]|uniref:uncharacterized protein n=1 Tax=Drosophila takahashii TaxID=29030 RepID=UPI0038995B9E